MIADSPAIACQMPSMIIMNPAKYVQPTAQPLLLVSKDLPLLEPGPQPHRFFIATAHGDIRVPMNAQVGQLLRPHPAPRHLASIVRIPDAVFRCSSEVRTWVHGRKQSWLTSAERTSS